VKIMHIHSITHILKNLRSLIASLRFTLSPSPFLLTGYVSLGVIL
jgi:hypothetical protein